MVVRHTSQKGYFFLTSEKKLTFLTCMSFFFIVGLTTMKIFSLHFSPNQTILDTFENPEFFPRIFPGFSRIFSRFWVFLSARKGFQKGGLCVKKPHSTHTCQTRYEKFLSRSKFDFFGLHSAFDFIPRYPSLRSVPLGIKSTALFRPKK